MLAGCGGSQPPIGTPGVANDVQQAHSHRVIFRYTGSEQTFKVPTGVTLIKVDALGAGGGGTPNSYDQEGGRGGRVIAELPVIPGESLAIFVGGTAHITSGGYNGGGEGQCLSCSGSGYGTSYGGGGATDIREGGTARDDRILVAGGGGGLGGAADGYGGGGGEGGSRTAGKGNNGGGNITRHCHSFGHGGSGGSQY
ncbi:MAG: glycine-rich protein, partial [Candidatus Cybelea sp.]